MSEKDQLSGFAGGHILQEFNDDLKELHRLALKMGGVLEKRIADWIVSVQGNDLELLKKIAEGDDEINHYENQLDEMCMQLIAKHTPAARDLRLIMAIHKAAMDLERIGDEIQKIAKVGLKLGSPNDLAPELLTELLQMSQKVALILKESLDLFARLNSSRVEEVLQKDEQIDQCYRDLIVRIDGLLPSSKSSRLLLDLAVIARSLERIGDHAKNMCEYVNFMVSARNIRHQS